ncbi:beta-ketoacyl-ACP synthase III [Leadbettera azotonutricia]|uniref:Beta-ketoacyl-[acyl-carrier-protein] synthase III n=1 Tax=Leadbettera azotonutricia (strain ATCC BAA-888 / DSM 13862 / ZAS-9) TaxID=545695 RepID=F5Y6Q1_LEAAZ|nr:beta-ketoacyl-ACP synthase III [Leadbettera azotonutricia]AEF82671.1 3-oxoacyl-[acyl-carrier-protein] synthase III protein 1 [Leadbettera azotonutricia ZAS-9]
MAIEITGTGKAVPPNRVTNDDLAAKMDTSDEWIRSHTGIAARHIADESTAASDLGLEAAKNALSMAAAAWKISPEEAILSLDLIIVTTATPDHLGCPSTACIIQDKLGARQAAAMDIVAGCTGFIYGLETAAGLLDINPNRKRALVIGAEILTKVTDWTDRGSCVLFGDGAGAFVLEKTQAPMAGVGKRGIFRSILAADGSGAADLTIERGGTRNPYKTGEIVDVPPHLDMNGQAVYQFAVKAITDTIDRLLKLEGLGVEDLAYIVPHQANARIVQAAAKRLRIPEEKFFLNIEEYANTSSASIPIACDELNRSGRLKKGDIIMTVGFGAGLTYGGNLIVW